MRIFAALVLLSSASLLCAQTPSPPTASPSPADSASPAAAPAAAPSEKVTGGTTAATPPDAPYTPGTGVVAPAAATPTATAPAVAAGPQTQPSSAYGKPITTEINPGKMITYRSTNREIQAYFVTPKVSGPVPGVIYVHDIFGMTEFAKEQANALARQGYAVIMPNLYSRLEHAENGFDAQNAWIAYNKTSDPQIVNDLRSALDYLNQEGQPTANQPVAVVGHDMGGIFAMRMASDDLRVKAAVNFYGRILYNHTTPERPTSPVEDVFNLTAPLLSFYGTNDPQIPPEQVRALQSRLENNPNHTYYELVRVPNVGHGFIVPSRTGYNAEAAKEATNHTRDFLARYLRAAPEKAEDE